MFSYSLVSGPDDGAIMNAHNNMLAFTEPGTYVVQLNVIDYSLEYNYSTFTVQVNPELTLASLPTINIDQHQNFTFYANASAGTKPYTYNWTLGCGLTVKSGLRNIANLHSYRIEHGTWQARHSQSDRFIRRRASGERDGNSNAQCIPATVGEAANIKPLQR